MIVRAGAVASRSEPEIRETQSLHTYCVIIINMKKILILGFGNMGMAIAQGIRKNTDSQVHILDPDKNAQAQAKKMKLPHYTQLKELEKLAAEKTLCIILAVKPQHASVLLQELAGLVQKEHRIISIMAGIHSDSIRDMLHTEQIVRFMPTIAAKIAKSVTGIYIRKEAKNKTALKSIAQNVASSFGHFFFFQKESDLAAMTGFSGSGIAFVTAFLDSLINAGLREGIQQPEASQIALRTMQSVCELLLPDSKNQTAFPDPSTLIKAICSPAGTTIEGIKVLKKRSLHTTVREAVHAAKIRAKSIESEFSSKSRRTSKR